MREFGETHNLKIINEIMNSDPIKTEQLWKEGLNQEKIRVQNYQKKAVEEYKKKSFKNKIIFKIMEYIRLKTSYNGILMKLFIK